MNNSLIDQIHAHASVRHYKSDPLTETMIREIVSAGQRASTSSNLQLYSVIAVTDQSAKNELAALADEQGFIREAPVFLVWCADLARLDHICHLQSTQHQCQYMDNYLTSVIDASLAAQNAALAAESLGLGICYVGALRNYTRAVIEFLHLPSLVFPLFGMTIGYPMKPARPKQRLPLDAILHWGQYNTDQDTYLNEYDRLMAESGIYKGRQTPYPGREEELNSYGWLEHSARRASRAARTDLSKILMEQGFALK